MRSTSERVVLGLDLGANSIGWALVQFEDKEPVDVLDMGVRLFEAGTDGRIEQGLDESRAVERREARQRRRQTDRRARRSANLARVLQQHGLLPEGDISHGKARHNFFVAMDKEIRHNLAGAGISPSETAGTRELPYFLRAHALDEPLDIYAIGRALYHLAQRRGYLSNRKSDKDEKEVGPVKEGIAELTQQMERQGVRTLGELLHHIDPVQEKRIRHRCRARSMYVDEFDKLWTAQQKYHHHVLNDTVKKIVHKTIFFQRPLKTQKGLVGFCELEPRYRRAPRALLLSQQFRILQKVNDLRLHFPDGTSRDLTCDEKQKLAAHMETKEKVTFAGIRTVLGRRGEDIEFNLERGGEKDLKGNVTAARIRKAMGSKWDALERHQRDAIVGELMGIHTSEKVRQRGVEAWGLDQEEAKVFSKIVLEEGYSAISKQALRKILPIMEQGIAFKTAEEQLYGDLLRGRKKVDRLPPVKVHKNDFNKIASAGAGMDIRNPVVMRTLSELRKVVNAILIRHRRPDEIHLELARDLKKNREDRKRITKDNRRREEKRKKAAERITKELGIPRPSRQDIEKVLLAEECKEECPYTGNSISMATLLGENPRFDIEHIIPYSRCLNDGFINKTLCYHEENRSVKGNRTPWEAYGGTDKWEAILERVKMFQGDAARIKLERFQLREMNAFEEMATQKLNDTRYASKLAARYMGMLYGREAYSSIQTNTGEVTAKLRNAWKLNSILGDGGLKNREDHRHHAIDALVIALTTRSAVKQLSDAATRQQLATGRTRGFEKIMAVPWDSFLQDVQEVVDNMVVSHRVCRKVRGRLHEDTNYSKPREDEFGKKYHVVRKPLTEKIKVADIENIMDPCIKTIVHDHYVACGGDSKKAFSDVARHPRSRENIPIHRVRIRKNITANKIGSPGELRYVTTDTNHHMEIVESTDAKGRTKWKGYVVDLLEAVQRTQSKQPVVNKDHGPGKRLVCTLVVGDVFKIHSDDQDKLFIVRSISKGNVEMVDILDARKKADIKADKGAWIKRSVDKLRQQDFQKLHVSPIGEVYPAND